MTTFDDEYPYLTYSENRDTAYGDSQVGTDSIADGAVTTSKIADGAVTAEKLAENALPIASATQLGGVKVGSGLSIDNVGVLSASSEDIQSLAIEFNDTPFTVSSEDFQKLENLANSYRVNHESVNFVLIDKTYSGTVFGQIISNLIYLNETTRYEDDEFQKQFNYAFLVWNNTTFQPSIAYGTITGGSYDEGQTYYTVYGSLYYTLPLKYDEQV